MKIKHCIAFLPLALLGACSQKPTEAPKTKDTDSAFRTDIVQLRNYEQELQFTGQVSFNQKQVDRIYPIVSGNVLEVNAELGAYVQRGQVLAKLQSADVSQYLKEYTTAKSNYDIAKRNADNVEQLYKTKFSSENDLITARKQLEIAAAEMERSKQVLKMYGGPSYGGPSNDGITPENRPLFLVKAPVSGYVVERNVNPNMEIRSDNANSLFTISNLSDVWVLINIYESDIQSVKIGQPVAITTLAYPDKTFHGRIENISQVVDNDSKVVQARVVLSNQNGLLKPDMFCAVKMHLEKPEKLLSVSPKSVIFSEDKYFVIRDNGRGNYQSVPVEVIKSTSRFSYIKAALKAGDRVVTEGALLLFNELAD
ncbi:efflux RND transporter periplasmic adaptor subunit [Runella slithyformis]|uniref:Efflux transporter, RND family, MFP subunit n=1 Tax=Runella slithyformis (strain ATCC 29530 / DSM 19594 / LMG 11500 / NCIMB 11436 / LSU 4) TaxID=761193 RepID=A0A7U4E6Z7_RUNSL|nr:efflux RND transporter periplasmic adaptor subunit [Runella slithyformis]AEI49783.1 efflux transporter, RND family, MFP subunit [Runella slithyformis DSM 19594]